MSKFSEFSKKIEERFSDIQNNGKLFRSSVDGNKLWDLYISSFKKGDNPVFRDPESSTNNCNLDKSFIRRYGNVVAIDESYKIVTMWDLVLEEDDVYRSSCENMSKILKSAPIKDVFFETFDELNDLPYEKINKSQIVYKLGFESNFKTYTKEEAEKFGVVTPGKSYQFFHFHGVLNKKFVDSSGKSQATILSDYRQSKDVFKRGLEEIPIDTLELVRDLINQGSLLDGKTHLYKIEQIIPFKNEYEKLSSKQKDNWCWVTSYNLPFSKFRNELIGTLCVELAEGVELNTACRTWNKRVDPANFMKATAPLTESMKKVAMKDFYELGYTDNSIKRRFATIDDINVNEILHSNVGSGEVKTASVFDSVIPSKPTRHKRSQFDGIEEVSIEKFMSDILPTCTSVEAFVENRMGGNFVALTTVDKESKNMFKWSNPFSWTFRGNLAGKSLIKEAVKGRGGNIDGVLNVRLHFPDTTNDYDLHLEEPGGYDICYRNVRKESPFSGMLDLDAQGVDGNQTPEKRVENITYSDLNKMKNGSYKVYIVDYSGNRFKADFFIEIEHGGEITSLKFDKSRSNGNTAEVCIIKLKDGEFKIETSEKMEITSSNTVSKSIFNIDTNQFHKVNLVCLSPNHWGDNNSGNKHYMFMIDGCRSDVSLRSFHNENLNSELVGHRKVMEVVGLTSMLEPTEKQLCGLGFNATVKDDLILKLYGTFKRTIKVKFN